MALENGRFVIENYHRSSTFSSFLPGISGIHGIPIWCYYVNRGQAVTSFGTETKDQSIMEFYPAHQSYQTVKTMGFRTFLKIGEEFYEPFKSDEHQTRMLVGMNDLEIQEVNDELGVKVSIRYYTLPEENLGGLVREVSITDLQGKDRSLELLDGMPAVIPYGIDLTSLKETGQTMKAWMQVEDHEKSLPYYRVRISTKDSAEVSMINRGNYYFSVDPQGELLPVIVDPTLVFSYDTSCVSPLGFQREKLEKLLQEKQVTRNNIPSGFSAYSGELKANEVLRITSVSGMAESKDILSTFAEKARKKDYFQKKQLQNEALTSSLTEVIRSNTGNPLFDEYARQTYLDNLVRGGHPVKLGDKVLHVFSRKHGDIERDYNYFRLSPEYYSQGNGNFRDVNQNRRSDVLFHPFVGDTNIRTFYNLMQMDGYNPLVVQATTYRAFPDEKIRSLIQEGHEEKVLKFLEKEFSPGLLLRFLEQEKVELKVSKEEFLAEVMNLSLEIQNADFGEGYWTDHFVYDLDQIESYLSVYPEKLRELLFLDRSYTYYASKAHVLPRQDRYVETPKGIRQYRSVLEVEEGKGHTDRLRAGHGKEELYTSTLMAKLLVMTATKFTALDMDGRGIEMEAGKPGWYDALNGLPGLFGSSVADACELLRLMRFIGEVMASLEEEVLLPVEVHELIQGVTEVMKAHMDDDLTRLQVWERLNLLKETYREKLMDGIKGEERVLETEKFLEDFHLWIAYLSKGLEDAVSENLGICPTYYMREVTEFVRQGGKIIPKAFKRTTLPLFLEGPVKYMKLMKSQEEKRKAQEKVRASALYDKKLRMYKVNASIEEMSFELGRARAFSPGWLENESIWLHMEYKYLLELLKNGLHEEFHEDLKTMCIPFLDHKVYGRSLLENSSFIASSANPDEKIHGKGFVARLSGSTAEFLEIWQQMMFGRNVFTFSEGELSLSFSPSLPEYLIPETLRLETTFLGTVETVYHLERKAALIPGKYQIREIIVTEPDGNRGSYKDGIRGAAAESIRAGKVRKIDVYISQK